MNKHIWEIILRFAAGKELAWNQLLVSRKQNPCENFYSDAADRQQEKNKQDIRNQEKVLTRYSLCTPTPIKAW